jgi:hypothetical protein
MNRYLNQARFSINGSGYRFFILIALSPGGRHGVAGAAFLRDAFAGLSIFPSAYSMYSYVQDFPFLNGEGVN